MRNFARVLCRVVAVTAMLGPLGRPVLAANDPLDRYREAQAQEQRVLAEPSPTIEEFRASIALYQEIVRRYPTSGYADNALWQAAGLAADAYGRFGNERDRRTALHLLEWLRSQYPSSSLVPRSAAAIENLGASGSPAGETQAPPASRHAADATPSLATMRAIQRSLLPEVVRVTLELDVEAPFHQERLAGPARVFFDFSGTRAVPSLRDVTLRYDDDVVRAIRVGRHPDNMTRVVLDLEGVTRYSVFTLYNPYRIVIDCERAGAPGILSRPGTETNPSIRPSMPAAAPVAVHPPAATPPPAAVSAPAAPPVGTPTATSSREPIGASPTVTVVERAPSMPTANAGGGFSLARQLGLGISRIVIDAGHGGHDPGATAFDLSESELVLDIALRLEALLLEQPGVEVVLTRRSDEYVPLEQRTALANRESADLFLSIHANASANPQARGVETYFLNFALNPEAEAVAARENAASGRTMNSLSDTVKAIALNSKIDESKDFAGLVQRALVQRLRSANKSVKDLGVKQAPFVVLVSAAMPSGLTEVSFVTNGPEARLLKSNSYRQRIAEALLNGIQRYQQALKKVQRVAQQ